MFWKTHIGLWRLGVDCITPGPKRSPQELNQKKGKAEGESQRQSLTLTLPIKASPPDCSQECLAFTCDFHNHFLQGW